MPLSEYEQRVLQELERDLGADPKLGQAMGRASRPRGHLTWAIAGVLAGLGVVLAGAVNQTPAVGIAGFALAIFAALWGLLRTPHDGGKQAAKGAPAKPSNKNEAGFMRRVEERFERRREQGDL